MAPGHSLPLMDIAKLFASSGVKSTIITTPVNATLLSKPIQTSRSLGFEIELVVIKFPSTQVGLPEGIEISNSATTQEMKEKFLKAMTLIEPKVEQILNQHRPHCLVADTIFYWATDVCCQGWDSKAHLSWNWFFPLVCFNECDAVPTSVEGFT